METLSLAVAPHGVDESMSDVAEQGSVCGLYSLIRSDPKVLHCIDKIPFVQTPLHTAVAAGQTKFAMEVLTLQGSFSKKQNEDGFTPMQLALIHGRTEIVERLLDFDEDLARVPGRDGLTPLHYVAQTDENLDLLAKFLKACPRSIEDVTNGSETVLHVALKNENFEAFRFLLGWLRRAWFKQAYSWEKKLLNSQDDEGNTVLHIAVAKKLTVIVKLLLKFNSYFRQMIDMNIKNARGLTVMDILKGATLDEDSKEINKRLRLTRRKCVFQGSSIPSAADYFKSFATWEEKIYVFFLRQTTNISDDTRNALLVVAALLVTITFQATVSPPGGVWSNNSPSANHQTHYRIMAGFNSEFNAPAPHAVGTVTMERNIFILLLVLNSVSFFVSVFSLLILLPRDLSEMFVFPLYILSLCFTAALFITAPTNVFGVQMPKNQYIIFCVLSPLLFLVLEGVTLSRRGKLIKTFLPEVKEVHPNLHRLESVC